LTKLFSRLAVYNTELFFQRMMHVNPLDIQSSEIQTKCSYSCNQQIIHLSVEKRK